jgi:hypothetical protein
MSQSLLAKDDRCESSIRCVFASMPLYSQGSSELADKVGSLLNDPLYKDQGLCVPVAATMMLSGLIQEKHPKTKTNNIFLDDFNNRPWVDNALQIGLDAKTNFSEGGTALFFVNSAFGKYFKHVKAAKRYDRINKGLLLIDPNKSLHWYKSKIKKYKYAFLIGTDVFEKVEKKILGIKIVYYKPRHGDNGDQDNDLKDGGRIGHGLVIAGYEGDKLLISDPWGVRYFTDFKREKLKKGIVSLKRKYGVFSNPSGSYGFMQKYAYNVSGAKDNKIILDSFMGISLD